MHATKLYTFNASACAGEILCQINPDLQIKRMFTECTVCIWLISGPQDYCLPSDLLITYLVPLSTVTTATQTTAKPGCQPTTPGRVI